MSDWVLWFVSAGVVVILELFTGTFYLLMIAIGLAAGGVAATMGASSAVQLLTASLVGVLAVYGLRQSRFGKRRIVDAAQDPNVNLDIGQALTVDAWTCHPGGRSTARVAYRGAMWDVELEPGEQPRSGAFVIREVRGSRLIVSGSELEKN